MLKIEWISQIKIQVQDEVIVNLINKYCKHGERPSIAKNKVIFHK